MRPLFATAALAAGLVASATLPASAQYWNDGWGWRGHGWGGGFGVSIGIGTPDAYAYGGYAPGAYAYSAPAGCTCPPRAALGYVDSYAYAPAYSYQSYAYAPRYSSRYVSGGAYAYDPGYQSYAYYNEPSYGWGGAGIAVRGAYREQWRGDNRWRRDNVRAAGFTSNDRVVRTNTRDRNVRRTVRDRDTVRSQRQGQARMTSESTMRAGTTSRGNAARANAEFRGGAQGRSDTNEE
jgi:hypothetical protein